MKQVKRTQQYFSMDIKMDSNQLLIFNLIRKIYIYIYNIQS